MISRRRRDSTGQRDSSGASDARIARHQRHAIHHAGCGDQLVRRVAPKVQSSNRPTHIERQRPDMDSRKRPDEFRIVEVDLDPAQLGQLRDLPEDDGGDAPWLACQKIALASGELTGEGAEEDVRVEIQHSIGRLSTERLP